MPYLSCPSCGLRIYRAATRSADQHCPRCKTDLCVNPGARPEPPQSIFRERRLPSGKIPPRQLLDLHKQIAMRIGYGGSLAQVEREIIASRSLDEGQLAALRLYAENQLHARELGEAVGLKAGQTRKPSLQAVGREHPA